MRKNYLIGHRDIVGMGYYFPEPNQEERYLESINDELAVRIGVEVSNVLSQDQQIEVGNLARSDLYEYLKACVPDIDEMLGRVRTNLLREIREKRKNILLEGTAVTCSRLRAREGTVRDRLR